MAKTPTSKKPSNAGKKLPKGSAQISALVSSAAASAAAAATSAAAAATPHITSPGGGFVPPGVSLTVTVLTNRGDLPYAVRVTDLTQPAASPATTPIPAPGPINRFNLTIPGASLQPSHEYEIFVRVDPAGPPHQTHSVTVNTFPPVGPTHIMVLVEDE